MSDARFQRWQLFLQRLLETLRNEIKSRKESEERFRREGRREGRREEERVEVGERKTEEGRQALGPVLLSRSFSSLLYPNWTHCLYRFVEGEVVPAKRSGEEEREL